MNEIRAVDPRHASDAECEAMNVFADLIHQEARPEDPPAPHALRIAGWRSIPPFVVGKVWHVWRENRIIASASGFYTTLEDNKHILQFDLSVLPGLRQQGLGSTLLAQIAEFARDANRRLLMTSTNERVPAGEAFMLWLGARKGLEDHINQLRIEDLDRDLLRRWLEPPKGYTMGFWNGPYPEDQLEAIIRLQEVMNTAPREQLEIEDFHVTVEQLRQIEEQLRATGGERWTLYVTDASGEFVGYTELTWNPNRPEIANQGATGVFPEHRGHGLGRWLKAAMLDKLLSERPTVKKVRTQNANSNAPMLKINHELGFKPYISNAIWQVETERVLERLGKQRVGQ